MLVSPLSRRILLAHALVLTTLGAAPALSQSATVDFNGVKGESTDKDHKDWTRTTSKRCDAHAMRPMNGAASDPEEGGQVSARKSHVSDMHVTKRMDKASPMMMESSPGGGC